jgi:hypothetical protein
MSMAFVIPFRSSSVLVSTRPADCVSLSSRDLCSPVASGFFRIYLDNRPRFLLNSALLVPSTFIGLSVVIRLYNWLEY